MDVVYLVKPAEQQYELRYSLRSLQNLPHDNVYLAGGLPSWVDGVEHLSTIQVPGEKHPNALRNWRAAMESDEVSDPFILMNDDHFVMQAQDDGMPVLNWGSVRDVINVPTLGSTFRRSMVATLEILEREGFEDPVSYQLHVPLIIHKAQLLDVMRRFPNDTPGIWLQYVTLAGNLYDWGGESYAHDVKVHDVFSSPDWVQASPFLSTSDDSFNRGTIGGYIRNRFKHPSPYER